MFFLYLNGHLHFFMWNSALYSLSCFYWIISLSLSFRFTKAFYKIKNLGHFLSYMLEIFLKFIICTFHGIFPSTLNTFYDICLNDKKRTSPHQNYKKISLKKKKTLFQSGLNQDSLNWRFAALWREQLSEPDRFALIVTPLRGARWARSRVHWQVFLLRCGSPHKRKSGLTPVPKHTEQFSRAYRNLS